MSYRQGRLSTSKRAKRKGELRKRRRKRAERRQKLKKLQEALNQQRSAEGHPGWVERIYL